MAWKSIVRSVVGRSHERRHLPCQDYGGDRTLGELVIGAIADGAGSAKHAEVGAKIAVETVLSYMAASEQWLHQHHQRSWQNLPQSHLQAITREFFGKSLLRVRKQFQDHAQQSGCGVEDLACTLLAFLATPKWLAAMQIGDGFLVVRLQQTNEYQLLFQPDKGEYTNQTTFVTSSQAQSAMQVKVLLGEQRFICAATDALECVALRLKDWTPFPPFFQPLEEYLGEISFQAPDDSYLMAFLQSERLNQRTDDDKTLLLCLHCQG